MLKMKLLCRGNILRAETLLNRVKSYLKRARANTHTHIYMFIYIYIYMSWSVVSQVSYKCIRHDWNGQ
jgi:hypothetical protein